MVHPVRHRFQRLRDHELLIGCAIAQSEAFARLRPGVEPLMVPGLRGCSCGGLLGSRSPQLEKLPVPVPQPEHRQLSEPLGVPPPLALMPAPMKRLTVTVSSSVDGNFWF